MNLKRLTCECNCGGFGQPLSCWITDTKALCLTCYCVVCEAQFNVLFPLPDLFKACPLPDLKAINEAIGEEISKITDAADSKEPKPISLTQMDKKFLKELKINFTAP